MNKSVMKCCICNNENIGRFITINNKKYHLCCIEQLQQENQELKKQLHEVSIGIQELIEQDIECPSNCSKLKEILNQQKEFIEYLEKKEKEFDILGDPKNAGACKGILRKYKEIIGGKE